MQNKALSLWQLSAMQLLKDCGKEIREDIIAPISDKEALVQLDIWVVSELLHSGSHSLTAALYRLDISEKKIRLQTQSLSANDRLIIVARAAAERCIQKVELRRLHSDAKRNG